MYSQHHTKCRTTEAIPTKVRNETRMPTFLDAIQYDFGIPRLSIKTKIRQKSDTNMEISSPALFICRLHGGISNRL
jgi:hypothetical protein